MKPPAYALELAASGIPVFPCGIKKRPCCERGFYAATTDPAEIAALWHHSPGPLIGFPTGPATGIDLLDIDPRHGGLDWLDEFQLCLPDTRTVQTKSGGTHFFFRHQQGMRNSQSLIAPGIDVRGEGGYCIAWAGLGGFIVRNVPAADWPEWLAVIALKEGKKAKKESVAFDPETGEILDGRPIPEKPWQHSKPKSEAKTREERRREVGWNMVEDALRRVEIAPAGGLHYAVCASSRTIGGLLKVLDISAGDAAEQLVKATEKAGAADIDNAKKTIASGLVFGEGEPLLSRWCA